MGEVKILTQYVLVPKGEDIRMIYNGTSSGLNSYLWSTNFDLPTVGSTLQAEERGNFISDRDIREMFLKLMLSEEVRSFCGVDVTNVSTEDKWERHMSGFQERWERNMMGLTDLPYHAFQVVIWANIIAMGERLD